MAKKAQDKTPKNAMDYAEHERTYAVFLKLSIWTAVTCIALLIAMVFGFYGGGGLIGGALAFVILMAASYFAI